MTPGESKFWSFSIDQFAFHDIPDSIDYILSTTGKASLSYIGFSQGTAQAFAALAIHPPLNKKVKIFIALAPAMSPPGLTSSVVDSFVKASPEVLFLAFGRKALMTSATMWQALLYPPIFVRVIDMSLSFLFGWKTHNIQPNQKLAAYPHLYSFTSTKSVVHWFQIIRNGKFQMYDDEYQAPWSVSDGARFYKVAMFPTRNIKTPILTLYGGSDSLVNISIMLKELPRHAVAKEIPHYEHLDFLWASDVDKQVFPHVFKALETYSGTDDADGGASWLKVGNNKSFADVLRLGPGGSEEIENSFTKHTQKEASCSPSQYDGSKESSNGRPDGWWSSDDGGNTTEAGTAAPERVPDAKHSASKPVTPDSSMPTSTPTPVSRSSIPVPSSSPASPNATRKAARNSNGSLLSKASREDLLARVSAHNRPGSSGGISTSANPTTAMATVNAVGDLAISGGNENGGMKKKR